MCVLFAACSTQPFVVVALAMVVLSSPLRRFAFVLVLSASASLVACRHGTRSPVAVQRARAYRVRDARDLVSGSHAAGRPGDMVLENRYVRAIIDDIRGGGGFALSGGQLIDLALREDKQDELGQVFNFLGVFPRQLRYRSMRAEMRADGTAAVIVTGDDPRTPGLEGETVYSLGPVDRAITLTTVLINHGSVPTEVGLGDAIQWAGAEHWAPGRGFALRGETEEPYLAGVGARVTYVYAAPRALFGPNGGNWSNPMQARTVLAPGASVRYVRRIGVSRAGDVAGALAVTGYVHHAQSVVLRAQDTAGAPLAGVRIVVLDERDRSPVAMGATNHDGIALVPVPAGRYTLDVWKAGMSPDDASAAVLARPLTVGPGQRVERTVTLLPGGIAVIRVFEAPSAVPVPARVLVYGVDGTATPMFGPIGRADGARNAVIVSHRAPVEIPLAPGRYVLVATRGPEYSLAEQTLQVTRGSRHEITLTVSRVVDTTGYLCGDFHTHQAPSLDSPVSLRDRVRAAVAEGLEVLAATDHNVATDLAAAVREESLDGMLLTLPGDEVSTDVALRPAGHWNLFPIEVRPEAPRGGAPDLFELDPATLLQRVRALAPGAVVQVNHPRSGIPTGVFDVVGFDSVTATATRSSLDPTFDAIEVWNGRYLPQVETVLRDWLALLRRGFRITATANSDSHAIVVQEVGYPRTCFRAPSDRVGEVTVRDVVRALRQVRDVILTDGPFVRVETLDGRSAIGRTVAPEPDGTVSLRVRVESPSWSAADVLEIVHADGRVEPVPIAWTRDASVVRGQAIVRVSAQERFVLFRARGTRPIPVLVDEPALYPLAITNPVYLDRNVQPGERHDTARPLP